MHGENDKILTCRRSGQKNLKSLCHVCKMQRWLISILIHQDRPFRSTSEIPVGQWLQNLVQ